VPAFTFNLYIYYTNIPLKCNSFLDTMKHEFTFQTSHLTTLTVLEILVLSAQQPKGTTLNISDLNPAFNIEDNQRQALRQAFYELPLTFADMRDMFTGFINDDIKSLEKKAGADLIASMGHKATSRDTYSMALSAVRHWTPDNYDSESEEAILTEMLRTVNDAVLRGVFSESMLPQAKVLAEYVGDILNSVGIKSLNPLFEGGN